MQGTVGGILSRRETALHFAQRYDECALLVRVMTGAPSAVKLPIKGLMTCSE
jgi:hypothetical protein